MKAFVTGGTGFLGRNLVEQLLANNWDVVVLSRPDSDRHGLEELVEIVSGDITDYRHLKNVVPSNVDVFFHVAGNTSLWRQEALQQDKVNILGTRNAIRAAMNFKSKRFIHTSSNFAYGLHSGTVTEDTPTRAISSKINYVKSKAQAEKEVLKGVKKGLDAVMINPSNAIGRHDWHNWSRLYRLMMSRRLPGVPAGGGSFCHAAAVADAHLQAVEKGRTGENYLLGGAQSSYAGLVQKMAEHVGRKVAPWPLPVKVLNNYARIEERVAPIFGREPEITRDAVELLSHSVFCSSRKAVNELGYEPVDIDFMLEDCIQWMRAVGLAK